MFNIGAGEMIVIALILLMAVGPEQLPSLIRRVGRTVSEVKGMTEGLRSEFMSGLEEIERATDPEAWAAGNEPTKVKPPKTAPANPFADSTTAASAEASATGETETPTASETAAVDAGTGPGSDDADADAGQDADSELAGDLEGPDGSDGSEGADAATHAFPDVGAVAEVANGAQHSDDVSSVVDPSVDAWVSDTPGEGESTGTEEQA